RCLSDWSSDVCSSDLHVLLARRSYSDAGRYAARMASRLASMNLPTSSWVEKVGDAAFLEKDYTRALARYQESAGRGQPGAALMQIGRASCRERVPGRG